LVLAQKILLKNVQVTDVLLLVVLSIPQFLMYTMPFSSLASASMTIGNLSSQNEILAIRSCGIAVKKVFIPIIVLSLCLSFGTLCIANRLIPYTTEEYKSLYGKMLQSVPALELESYSSTVFGQRVITCGLVDGNTIEDIVILDNSDSSQQKVVKAKKGVIEIVDLESLLYRIILEEPEVMITNSNSNSQWTMASGEEMILYLGLNSSNQEIISITPSRMSIDQLKAAMADYEEENKSMKAMYLRNVADYGSDLGDILYDIEYNNSTPDVNNYFSLNERFKLIKGISSFSFYYQYYRSELHKKIALSLACTFLVFIAFPISFFRVRNGRLLGFGISMFIACVYWFFIYYMHVQAISSPLNPALFLWLPNAVAFVVGSFFLWRLRKQ
ncbi:MAG: LptF/LptG family permease, partial [Sphaerochaetaceae bacterium]|nr:LptF/LptG family permease [Sphaerochaetaceae bacterium]